MEVAVEVLGASMAPGEGGLGAGDELVAGEVFAAAWESFPQPVVARLKPKKRTVIRLRMVQDPEWCGQKPRAELLELRLCSVRP
jgi:hypothetical protein